MENKIRTYLAEVNSDNHIKQYKIQTDLPIHISEKGCYMFFLNNEPVAYFPIARTVITEFEHNGK